jgi:2-polyprenyl-3-methyl-5-hydroxy-6-metoxy-1,4-benzoquinol methylase
MADHTGPSSMPIDYKSTSRCLYQREAFKRSLLARQYRSFFEKMIRRRVRGCRRLLDVGAGEAILLENLRAEGMDGLLVAADLDAENASICHQMGFPAVRTDAGMLAFGDGVFDGVVLMSVLEHVENPKEVLREAYRVLSPEGIFVVLVPNDRVFDVARRMMGRKVDAHKDLGHLTDWTPETLRDGVQRAGFRVIESRNLPLPWWTLSLHHMVVARRQKT